MIHLIAGATHTGKTAYAQKMLEKHGYPYLSMDHLKMGLIRSGQTDLTPMDDEKLTDYLWPIVREMIALLEAERENAEATIPLAEYDSSIGFEPSMHYVTDPKRLIWKMNQVDEEIAMLRAFPCSQIEPAYITITSSHI